MPNPAETVTPSPSSTTWLDSTPGGDIPLSELFPDLDTSATAQTPEAHTTAPQTPTTQPTEPQTPTQTPQFGEIRTKTGSVYKTLEAVTSGIEEKDTLIGQLRDQLKSITGQDPLQRRPQAPTQETSYLSQPEKYAEDLADAAKKGDASKYLQTQLRLWDEYLGPARGILQEFTRTHANEQLRNEIEAFKSPSADAPFKRFEDFRASEEFNQTLQRNPTLSNAINGAESDIRYASQLPELYRLAYESYAARAVKTAVTPAVTTTQQRASMPSAQTTQSSTLTPATHSLQSTPQDMLRSKDGRKALIEQFERSGQQNSDWSTIRGW